MKGLSLNTNNEKSKLIASVDPLVFGPLLNKEELVEFVNASDFGHFHLSANSILELEESIAIAADEDDMTTITQIIGELKEVAVSIALSEDNMECTASISATSGSMLPNINAVKEQLKTAGVKRGVSEKRIRQLLQMALDNASDKPVKIVVAKGLPPRKGKDSIIKPTVPNAIDRILAPQESNDSKVDMRNLGDILSVDARQVVAKRTAPTKGRSGFTVTNKKLPAPPGEWKVIKLGANTAISEKNENTIIATVSGQPKFKNNVMNVDDTFTSKGVNVGTGNIKYNGAVVVNGDITEQMQVVADGDVTVNGFVESALIRAGGDIIITQGATGKMNIEDCQLIAGGSIFIQHGQGLDIVSGKDIHIAKQLAYSKVKCRGEIIVGSGESPMGNLFASSIICHKTVRAGSVGAVSGSQLTIDFSEGYNVLAHRAEALADLFNTLSNANADHEIKIAALNSRHIPAQLKKKLATLTNELDSERILLNWLRLAKEEMTQKKQDYEMHARIIANKELFPGVVVKLNKKMWKAEKEYQRCRIILENGAWLYDPLTQ